MKTHWPEKFESGMFAFAVFVYIFYFIHSLYFLSFLPSTSLWGVYSETFIYHYSIFLDHAFTRLCMTCTSCIMPLALGQSVQVLYSCFISNS